MPNQSGFEIQTATLPPNWNGTMQDYTDLLPDLITIELNEGFSTFVTGSIEPTSNVGPWLRNNEEWYVWSDAEGRYVPQKLDEKIRKIYVTSYDPFIYNSGANPNPDQPVSGSIWVKTVNDAITIDNIYVYIAGGWRATSWTKEKRDAVDADLYAVVEENAGGLKPDVVEFDNITDDAIASIRKTVLASTYPVGTIYENATSGSNPATLMQWPESTWEKFGEGRVLVGEGTGSGLTTRTVGQTGGAETKTAQFTDIPDHFHWVGRYEGTSAYTRDNFVRRDTNEAPDNLSVTGYICGGTDSPGTSPAWSTLTGPFAITNGTQLEGVAAESEDFSIMQPFIVVYRWRRLT